VLLPRTRSLGRTRYARAAGQEKRRPPWKLSLTRGYRVTAYPPTVLRVSLARSQFPSDKKLLTGCVGFYTLACAALHALGVLVEKNWIVRTYDKTGLPGSALRIATTLPRGDHMMKVEVEFRNPWPGLADARDTYSRSVGNYFNEKGEIDEIALQRDLQVAIVRMEQQYSAKLASKDK
jgi:hypothetical protein